MDKVQNLSDLECNMQPLKPFRVDCWGAVQLSLLGTAAANRPIVPAPDDYDDG
jgi:hypothetical protein